MVNTMRGQRGVTVLELLVAMTLLVATMSAIAAALVAPYRAWMAGRDFADEQQNARLALEWMTRRVRLAGVGASAGTAEYVTEGAQTAVAFLADLDQDGTAEVHRFCLDVGTGVVREQAGAQVTTACATGSPITSPGEGRPLRVVLLTFEYADGMEQPLGPLPLTVAQRAMVGRVKISLGLDSDKSGTYNASRDLTFATHATIRNY